MCLHLMRECHTTYLRAIQHYYWYGLQEALLNPEHVYHETLKSMSIQTSLSTDPYAGIPRKDLDTDNQTARSRKEMRKSSSSGLKKSKYALKTQGVDIKYFRDNRLVSTALYGPDIVFDFQFDNADMNHKLLNAICRSLELMLIMNSTLRTPFRVNFCNADPESDLMKMLADNGVMQDLAVRVCKATY